MGIKVMREEVGRAVVFAVEGSVDIASSPELRGELRLAVEQKRPLIVVDMAGGLVCGLVRPRDVDRGVAGHKQVRRQDRPLLARRSRCSACSSSPTWTASSRIADTREEALAGVSVAAMTDLLASVGRGGIAVGSFLWECAQLVRGFLYWTVIAPFKGYPIRFHEAARQSVRVGVQSVPIVFLVNFFVGATLAFTVAEILNLFGATEYTAAVHGRGLLARAGTAADRHHHVGLRRCASLAAEIGTMKVGEELMALDAVGTRPRPVPRRAAHAGGAGNGAGRNAVRHRVRDLWRVHRVRRRSRSERTHVLGPDDRADGQGRHPTRDDQVPDLRQHRGRDRHRPGTAACAAVRRAWVPRPPTQSSIPSSSSSWRTCSITAFHYFA